MIFINTRPANRAKPLSLAMQDKGLTVLELPLLELVTIDINKTELDYQQHFIQQAEYYQALIVVSPTAARIGLEHCPKGFVPKCPVIAVGHATAKVLEAAGWKVQCPDEYSNEGMMRMPELNTLGAGNNVLVWRGRGGRRVLINFLQDNDVVVDAIAWYLRRCPPDAFDNFIKLQRQLAELTTNTSKPSELLHQPNDTVQPNIKVKTESNNNTTTTDQVLAKPIVLISSGEAFTNWRLMYADAETKLNLESKPETKTKIKTDTTLFNLEDFKYLTFGKRLTDTLQALDLNCVQVEHLDTDEVYRGIVNL